MRECIQSIIRILAHSYQTAFGSRGQADSFAAEGPVFVGIAGPSPAFHSPASAFVAAFAQVAA